MIISRTPLRASFFGGGSDLSGYYKNCAGGYGAVLSSAINMYVYITVNKKFDDQMMPIFPAIWATFLWL